MLHIGDVVRKLRIAQGLTIPQLADEAGVNPKTISKVERGEANSQLDTLGHIAHALGCPNSAALDARLDAWCAQRIGPSKLKPEWRELLALWEQLDVEAQRTMLGLIRRELRLVRRQLRVAVPHPETPVTRGRPGNTSSQEPSKENEAPIQRQKTGLPSNLLPSEIDDAVSVPSSTTSSEEFGTPTTPPLPTPDTDDTDLKKELPK